MTHCFDMPSITLFSSITRDAYLRRSESIQSALLKREEETMYSARPNSLDSAAYRRPGTCNARSKARFLMNLAGKISLLTALFCALASGAQIQGYLMNKACAQRQGLRTANQGGRAAGSRLAYDRMQPDDGPRTQRDTAVMARVHACKRVS